MHGVPGERELGSEQRTVGRAHDENPVLLGHEPTPPFSPVPRDGVNFPISHGGMRGASEVRNGSQFAAADQS
jgi:hypothetical protein